MDGIPCFVLRQDGSTIIPKAGTIGEAGQAAPGPGAMWWEAIPDEPAPGGPNFFSGTHLVVMTPGGPWNLDGRSPQCSIPDDLEHRCWARRGRPPILTVWQRSQTCADDGRVVIGDFRGWLRDGLLVPSGESFHSPERLR